MARLLKNLLILLIIAGIGYYLYGRFMAHPPAGGWGAGGTPTVSVAEAIEREVQQWKEFSGRLVAVDTADVRPRVTGTIESIAFKDGAAVKKGDLLFVIDQRPFAAEVKRAEGLLAAAEAQQKLAATQMDRADRLITDKAIPQSDYDRRQNDLNVADAALKSARATLDTARLNLGYTEIRAPISGRASRAEITLGNLVESGPNAPVLTTIVTRSPIYADFEVDEDSFLRYVEANGADRTDISDVPVQMGLASDSGTPRSGHIDSFDNRIDASSGTLRVRAVFDNTDGKLVPGLFARVRLGSANAKAVLITERAVGTDQNKRFVMVVGPENKVEYREVKLGGIADNLRVVTEGLKAGEKIIVNGLQRARPGAPVQPELVSMDGKDEKPAAEAPPADQPAAEKLPEAPPEEKPAEPKP